MQRRCFLAGDRLQAVCGSTGDVSCRFDDILCRYLAVVDAFVGSLDGQLCGCCRGAGDRCGHESTAPEQAAGTKCQESKGVSMAPEKVLANVCVLGF